MRLAILASVVLLAACGGTDPLGADTPSPADAGPKPTVTPPDPAALPAPADRMGALNLLCGAETYRVAFEETRAVVVNDDGTNTELPKLAPTPDSEPGVNLYTDGKITFAKQGGGDTPVVVRFARARMAFVNCSIAQN